MSEPVACDVIVVTYQSADTIGDLLRDLSNSDGVCLRTTVVDNNSVDRTVEYARQFDCSIIEMQKNSGYAAAINAALREATHSAPVLVLNPDTRVTDRRMIEKLVRAALEDAEAGIYLPLIISASGDIEASLRREPSIVRVAVDGLLGPLSRLLNIGETVSRTHLYSYESEFDWATGAAMLLTERCIAEIGEWDSRFFLYSEETDYFRRAREARLKIRVIPAAMITHEGGASGRSSHLDALLAINKVRYYEKYHSRGASELFRSLLLLGNLLRGWRPANRKSAYFLARRHKWTALIAELQAGRPTRTSREHHS